MTIELRYAQGKFILTVPKEGYKAILRGLLKNKEADTMASELLDELQGEHELMAIELDEVERDQKMKDVPF